MTAARTRRGERLDVVVAGGGVVGAACALSLARAGLEVALVEPRLPGPWSPSNPDLRVYALAPDSAALFAGLGCWDAIEAARAQPYRRMRVHDAAGGGELAFDADTLGRRELGWIVEHGLLVDRLWATLGGAGVRVSCPARVDALEQDADGVTLSLDDGRRLSARVAIAADGAGSPVRRMAGIAAEDHDYRQRGVVGYVAGDSPHQATAWQRFLPSGPLALLPVPDLPGARRGHAFSIVWSLPEEESARILALDDDRFAAGLARAAGGRFGALRPLSARAAFPLRRQLAATHRRGRVLVLGDAAHVVHPLAGQGVNLGLRDVAALRDSVVEALNRRIDWDAPGRLARWARRQRSANSLAAHAFDAIARGFGNDHPVATAVRGPLLGLAGRLPPLSRMLWRHAAGVGGRRSVPPPARPGS